MPELPDVEMYKQYIDATSLHQTIESVDVLDHRILDTVSFKEIESICLHSQFDRTYRHGKILFILFENSKALLLHFGMSGNLKYFLKPEDQPGHSRVIWTFKNGYHLAYISVRMFGKITRIQNVTTYLDDHQLGPDALDIDAQEFTRLFETKHGMIKSALMDQRIIAGLGNIYVDELLFHAQIHPETSIPHLSGIQINRIFESMEIVLTTAIDARVNFTDFPENYLITHRKKDGTCPECSCNLNRIKVASRTTYYCPQCQTKTNN